MIIDKQRWPGFIAEAVYSDQTRQFCNPCEPEVYDTMAVSIRVARDNVKKIDLISEGERQSMRKVRSTDLFDYYLANVGLTDKKLSYFFELQTEGSTWVYDRMGITREPRIDNRFVVTPGFHTPEWAKGAVMYQIFVDRFCNGDPTNDVQTNEYHYLGENAQRVSEWSRNPDSMDVQDFYGGDLKGVLKKLDYLQGLGVEVLYLNPIFVSPSNHKYDIQDYDYVDPHYGVILKDNQEGLPEGVTDNRQSKQYVTRVTSLENLEGSNEFFIQFVEEVHRRGMKVILDGVFNHCGSFNKWLDREGVYDDAKGFEKGAYKSEESPYVTFFDFKAKNWPNNDSYDGWWGHKTLPKLNYENSTKLYSYIMRIARKWVSPPYNCDGWRLDVAADLAHSREFNHMFWKDFRKNVKAANPNALILAEHYGDASEWLQGDEWDSVMNYDAFMEPVTWFLTGMQKHSDEFQPAMLCDNRAFIHAMNHYMARFQTPSRQVAMNQLSNHDHSRFLTRTNRRAGRASTVGSHLAEIGVDKAVMREAVLLQMTWTGAPTIYYGDEAGVCGWTDPDNRRTYPWGREDKDLIAFHREAIRIHKSYQAFRTGSLMMISSEPGMLCYSRFDDEDIFLVVIYNNDQPKQIQIPAWKTGLTDESVLVRLIYTNADTFGLDAHLYHTRDGLLTLNMPPRSGIILKNMK